MPVRFDITILGCGAAVPTLQYKPTAQVVNLKDSLYLIDCGEGTQVQLRQLRIKFQKINQIFISHLHGDHFFGLIGLISTYHLLGRKQKLQIFGPPGLEEIIRVQLKHSGTYLNYPLEFYPTDHTQKREIFEDKNCRVYSLPLKHRIACTGFLFEEKPGNRKLLPEKLEQYGISIAYANRIRNGEDIQLENGIIIPNSELTRPPDKVRQYAFCSDTAYYPDLVTNVSGVDCLYHESTFLEHDKERAKQTRHSTAMQAAEVAKQAGVGKLVLGHFSARYSDLNAFLMEAGTVFEKVSLAEEGRVFNVK